MPNETNKIPNPELEDLRAEVSQLTTILEGFEKVLISITNHYDGILQNLDTLKTSVQLAQQDCNQLTDALNERKAIKQAQEQSGIQGGGTG